MARVRREKRNYVIGFDLGTKTGVAVFEVPFDKPERLIKTVRWDYSGSRFVGGGMRYLLFARDVRKLFDEYEPIAVGLERVDFMHKGKTASDVYGGLLGTLTMTLEERQIPYNGYAPNTIKKRMTGYGRSSKEAVVTAVLDKYLVDVTEDEADACGAALCVLDDLV